MNSLLAIDTATDALSVALLEGDRRRSIHRVMPRQHQQQLFPVLGELLEGRAAASLNLSAIVYGRGPGSFTGIRIAVSAAQGLGYSLAVPLIGLSSLETQARTLLRRAGLDQPCNIVSSIDARIGQLYAQYFHFDGDQLRPVTSATLVAPDALALPPALQTESGMPLLAVGNGYQNSTRVPAALEAIQSFWPDIRPEAEDMLSPALQCLAAGNVLNPAEALPDYVQEQIGWKTLEEQAKAAPGKKARGHKQLVGKGRGGTP